eukprot:COSAG05_NODE_274_length_12437_cov_130.209353_2_plen_262_part_00
MFRLSLLMPLSLLRLLTASSAAQVGVIRREENLIEAYTGSSSLKQGKGELVVPQGELDRAEIRIRRCKRWIRESLGQVAKFAATLRPVVGAATVLMEAAAEGASAVADAGRTTAYSPTTGWPAGCQRLAPAGEGAAASAATAAARHNDDETFVSINAPPEVGGVSDDGIEAEDIICSLCHSGEVTTDANDIVLCDAPACPLAFHIKCVEHGLGQPVKLGGEGEEWWCPLCNTMWESVEMLNEVFNMDFPGFSYNLHAQPVE